jgi:hypothetical protein
MKVSMGMSLFTIDLVGKETMRLTNNNDIKQREGVKLLGFHCELNGRRNSINIVVK